MRANRPLPAVLHLATFWALFAFWAVPWARGADEAVGLRTVQDERRVTFSSGERTLLVYRFGDVARKPYAEKLFTPGGVNLLRDAPHDHLHHHALMFAVAVDGVDFWSENDRSGRQVHRAIEGVKSEGQDGEAWASLAQTLDWRNAAGDQTLAVERRTVGLWRPKDAAATVILWETRLEPGPGRDAVKLGGSHYFGLGMRWVESMDRGGRFFNPDGAEGDLVRGQERLVRTRWCAYTARAEGKPVTAAMLDHPKNPRHPAHFFTMPAPFAYLSATLNYWKEPLEVKRGEPLVLRYAVAVWDGETKAEEVEKLYQAWTKR